MWWPLEEMLPQSMKEAPSMTGYKETLSITYNQVGRKQTLLTDKDLNP